VSQDLDHHLAASTSGESEGFARWVARAEPVVRASVRPLAASVDAEAIVQETLLRVWQVIPRFAPDGRPNAFLRFALRVCRNLALDELRRLRAEPGDMEMIERALESAGEVAEPIEPDPLLRRLLEECRGRLPAQPGRALAARLESHGTQPDRALAVSLGMQLNTFLQNVSRARRFLLQCLEEHGVHVSEELR
jgi:RNA polymerase sigma-70 factor (ECF subfamily)